MALRALALRYDNVATDFLVDEDDLYGHVARNNPAALAADCKRPSWLSKRRQAGAGRAERALVRLYRYYLTVRSPKPRCSSDDGRLRGNAESFCQQTDGAAYDIIARRVVQLGCPAAGWVDRTAPVCTVERPFTADEFGKLSLNYIGRAAFRPCLDATSGLLGWRVP